MSVNKVILVGNVGQNPIIKSTQNDRELASFSLATSDSWKDKTSGERKEKTEWHRVVVYSQGLVEIVKKYLKKGDKVYLEGQLQTRKWADDSGVEKYTTEIVLQNFNSTLQILNSKNEGKEESKAPKKEVQKVDFEPNQFEGQFEDDEITF
jgi:single-strand DNA-binding protein